MDPEKIAAITQWPIPTSMTEVRSFMGAAQYLRKLIANLSAIAAPLHAMTAKGNNFCWGRPQQRAFEDLKSRICNASVLAMPNLQRPFELETDASGYALGAVLLQGGRPVCYHHSELFHGAVLYYPNYDKELFAIVQVVKRWKHYLLGKETIIHTYHQPLQYLQSQRRCSR